MTTERNGLAMKYFQLDRSINESRERIKSIRHVFYAKSMHTRQEYAIDGEMIVRGFKQDIEVVRFVDCIADIQKHIKKNQKRKRYLKQYIHTLPECDQNYLYERYKKCLNVPVREGVEAALIDEINEIETAIHYMYGFLPETTEITQTGDFKDDFQKTLEALGVK